MANATDWMCPFDHIRPNILDIRIIGSHSNVTMASITFLFVEWFICLNELTKGIRVQSIYSIFNCQLRHCICREQRKSKRSSNWGHFYMNTLLIMIFIVRRCVPKRDRTTKQMQFIHSTALQWLTLAGRRELELREVRAYTIIMRVIINMLFICCRIFMGSTFHTIYNHFYIRRCCSASKCVYYKWSGLVPNAR